MSLLDTIRFALNENPFSGNYKKDRMRPPGSVDEGLFLKLCVRCSRCVEVCPYKVLKRSTKADIEIGTPFIYAEEAGCHLCMKCTSVCPTGAIDPKVQKMEQTAIGIARINEETCNNYKYDRQERGEEEPDGKAAICSSCFNVCPLQYEAIRLDFGIVPVITDKCTGCGMCVERCPNRPRSITIIPKNMPDPETAGYYYYLKKSGTK